MQFGNVSSKFAGALAALTLCTASTGALGATTQEASPDPMAPVVDPTPPPPVAQVQVTPPAAPVPVQEVLPAPPVAPPPVAAIGGGGVGGIGISPVLLGLGALVGAGLLYLVLGGKKKKKDDPAPTPAPAP